MAIGDISLPRGGGGWQGAHRRHHGRERQGRGARTVAPGTDAGLCRLEEKKRRLSKLPSFGAGAKRKDVLFFTQELSTLLNSGVPLDRALQHHQ